MILIVILVVAVMLVAVALGVTSHRRRKSDCSNAISESEIDTYIIKICYDVLIKTLDAIVNSDPIESCRICRKTDSDIKSIRNSIDRGSDDRHSVNIDYMIESLLRISETGKSIATNPNDGINIPMKCELETLRDSLSVVRNGFDDTRKVYSDNNKAWSNESANCKDFIAHLIDVHGKSMKHDDFNDGAVKYGYFMLLHYMLSFQKSAIRLLQSQYSNHHGLQY